MDWEAWWATVHRVAKSRAKLSDFTFTFRQQRTHMLPHKKQNTRPKQHCNKLNKDFKNGPHQKSFLKIFKCINVKWKLLSGVWLFATQKILQARILQWVAFPFSRGSSQPRDPTQVSHTAGRFVARWTTRKIQQYWSG